MPFKPDLTDEVFGRLTVISLSASVRHKRTVAEWAEIGGKDYHVVKLRLRRGWPAKEAVFAPLNTFLRTLHNVA